MMSYIFNACSASLIVLLSSIFIVNFLPDHLFDDFPFEPRVSELLQQFSDANNDWNTKLTDATTDYIQLNQIVGPESISVAENGKIYTGLADGRIVEIESNGKKIKTIFKFNKSRSCKENDASQPELCGRFLQVRLINNTLYAIDSKSGLYSININTGSATLIASNKHAKINLYNSFVFDHKNTDIVYLSISSTRWPLSRIVWSIIELDNSGQIVAYNLKTKESVVVFDKLSDVNGIDIDQIHDQLLFSETSLWKVNKAPLADIRKALATSNNNNGVLSNIKRSDLVSQLPGYTDNIFVKESIAYIALPRAVKSQYELKTLFPQYASGRKAIARLVYGAGKLLEKVSNYYNHPTLEFLIHEFKSGHLLYRVQKQQSGVIAYDLEKSTYKFLGTDKFAFISEAVVDNKGNMYLGSFRSPFIAKIKIP